MRVTLRADWRKNCYETWHTLGKLWKSLKAAGQLALQVMLILGLVVLKFYIFAGGESPTGRILGHAWQVFRVVAWIEDPDKKYKRRFKTLGRTHVLTCSRSVSIIRKCNIGWYSVQCVITHVYYVRLCAIHLLAKIFLLTLVAGSTWGGHKRNYQFGFTTEALVWIMNVFHVCVCYLLLFNILLLPQMLYAIVCNMMYSLPLPIAPILTPEHDWHDVCERIERLQSLKLHLLWRNVQHKV